ncbi:MAG: DUF2851 family protein [Ignavibacteriaceae bacterium]|nr:DUF2851 family protein [Ignavibacteriaceae bacterium]
MDKVVINEKFLYEIWKNQEFERVLVTEENEPITVIDCGTINSVVGGPDFRNARIKIGNITFQGDVEIDLFHSDWKGHGHYINKQYNKLILHVVLNNDSKQHHVITQNGRKVPSVLIESFLKKDLRSEIQKAILSERENRLNQKMPCHQINSKLTKKEKLTHIFDLGFTRFRHKRENVLLRLKELTHLSELNLKEPIISYDLDERFYNRKFSSKDFANKQVWYQLIFESIFEALGYSNNKDIMRRLAEAVQVKFLSSFLQTDDFVSVTESVLFNVAGLVPDVEKLPKSEVSDYTLKLFEQWKELKQKYDGRTFHSTNWHFFRLRPQNFPTIRLAGGARLLNKLLKENMIENIITIFKKTNNPRRLSSDLRSIFLIKASGYWKKHYVFDQPSESELKYFIGMSRADEIIINIILPIMSIYFEIFNKHDLAKKVLKLYLNYYQVGENSIVSEVTNSLQLDDAAKRTVYNQGMIELYKEYCIKEKCLECSIGQKVFN